MNAIFRNAPHVVFALGYTAVAALYFAGVGPGWLAAGVCVFLLGVHILFLRERVRLTGDSTTPTIVLKNVSPEVAKAVADVIDKRPFGPAMTVRMITDR